LTGHFPFGGARDYDIEDKIVHCEYLVDDRLKSPELAQAKDLLSKLFKKNPTDRIGGSIANPENKIERLKSHLFFSGINFDRIHEQSPPLQTLSTKVDFLKYQSFYKSMS
jgi:hypothetical protein